MSNVVVVTTCDRDYARPWAFPSLGFLSCRVVCLLHPADTRPLPVNVGRAPYETPGVLYQDGRFLDTVPGVKDEDVVVLVDADGVFQRDFAADELRTLANVGGGVALGYNMRPGQRGAEEHEELRPRQCLAETAEALGLPEGLLAGAWVYNTGLVAARASTWRRVRALFAEAFGGRDAAALFGLHSWPQYLLCLLFQRHGIPVTELGYETHSHGHFAPTSRHRIDRRRLYHDGGLVLFAHAVPGVSH